MKKKIIAITTGGTGGHVFPAKALADSFPNDYKIMILLDKRAYENNYKWKSEYIVKKITSLGMHKKSIVFLCKMALCLFVGCLQSLVLFINKRPKVLVSFGGYASIPATLAAILLNIPVIMHEQNAVLGKAHKLFVKKAKYLALTFKNTKGIENIKNIEVVGLPIREDFYNNTVINKEKTKEKEKTVILILGGSQGAVLFGKTIPEAFAMLDEEQKAKIKIYHQCRVELQDEVEKLWIDSKIEYEIKPFFHNIYNIMVECDLIIARSGSATIAEINVLNKKALYIPFAKAAENHQELNAKEAKRENQAEIILEKEFNKEALHNFISDFISNIKESNSESKSSIKEIKATDKLKKLVREFL